ncbi:hypothetical protein J6590_041902 [Homalodisca vitripennis]|nr:hypothetical protein J6590_041902 [Homalodisca vitripennis]
MPVAMESADSKRSFINRKIIQLDESWAPKDRGASARPLYQLLDCNRLSEHSDRVAAVLIWHQPQPPPGHKYALSPLQYQ